MTNERSGVVMDLVAPFCVAVAVAYQRTRTFPAKPDAEPVSVAASFVEPKESSVQFSPSVP